VIFIIPLEASQTARFKCYLRGHLFDFMTLICIISPAQSRRSQVPKPRVRQSIRARQCLLEVQNLLKISRKNPCELLPRWHFESNAQIGQTRVVKHAEAEAEGVVRGKDPHTSNNPLLDRKINLFSNRESFKTESSVNLKCDCPHVRVSVVIVPMIRNTSLWGYLPVDSWTLTARIKPMRFQNGTLTTGCQVA